MGPHEPPPGKAAGAPEVPQIPSSLWVWLRRDPSAEHSRPGTGRRRPVRRRRAGLARGERVTEPGPLLVAENAGAGRDRDGAGYVSRRLLQRDVRIEIWRRGDGGPASGPRRVDESVRRGASPEACGVGGERRRLKRRRHAQPAGGAGRRAAVVSTRTLLRRARVVRRHREPLVRRRRAVRSARRGPAQGPEHRRGRLGPLPDALRAARASRDRRRRASAGRLWIDGARRGVVPRARARDASRRGPRRPSIGRAAELGPLLFCGPDAQGRADGRSRARGGVRAAQTPEGIGVPIMMLVVPVVSASSKTYCLKARCSFVLFFIMDWEGIKLC